MSNATSRMVLSTKSKQIEHVQCVSTLSKGRNFAKKSFDTVANVEVTFDFVERIIRLVAFDNVASTLLLVWTGLDVLSVAVSILTDDCCACNYC